MTSKKYQTLRQYAIEASLEWREYHLAQMESALSQDHTITAQDQFTYAERAEYCANWLKSATRKQFGLWYQHYTQTSSMIVNEG